VIINAARRIKKIAFIKEKSHVLTWDFLLPGFERLMLYL
jgi:hypothetical protein